MTWEGDGDAVVLPADRHKTGKTRGTNAGQVFWALEELIVEAGVGAPGAGAQTRLQLHPGRN
jgi:hypothetical protein